MSDPKIGLALGGGSARGLAHIPMLEVFDEMGIKPAAIAGCSIGALMGAAYASGIPAKEMRERALKLLLNRVEAAKYVFGAQRARISELLMLRGLSSLHIKGEKLVSMSFPEGVAKNIEDTRIPFKVIATDFESIEERVFTTGPMARAVAASIAIPGVIAAPMIDGRIHVDGGITNPVPFNHVRDGMDIVVAIDVTGRPRSFKRSHPTNMELAIGSMLIMFHQIADLRRALSPPDIYIEPPVENFAARDFFRAKEMLEAGDSVKDKLKRALEMRINGTD